MYEGEEEESVEVSEGEDDDQTTQETDVEINDDKKTFVSKIAETNGN